MSREPDIVENNNYVKFLNELKQRIRTAQVKAVLAVNRELTLLYWEIGCEIIQRQEKEGWGAKVIDQLAKDLRKEFPDIKGLSRSNLKNMRIFAQAYPDKPISQQLVGQLPWGHNIRLLEMVKDPEKRQWYVEKTIENGWSRNVLVMQIESKLYERQGKAVTNFPSTLPQPQSDLAQQLIKDPYNFDFLTLEQKAHERDLERALVTHMRDFLLELGVGFSFVGSQYPLEVAGEEYRLDLLFYHLKLRCFVILELKMQNFKPEFSGKMNFYLNVVDDLLRHPSDNPTLGIILCKSKKNTVVEYALSGVSSPIGVSTHTVKELPDELQSNLPTPGELQREFNEAAAEINENSASSDDSK